MANGVMAMPMRSITQDGKVTESKTEPLPQRPDIPYSASLITPEWRIEEALRLHLTELGGAGEFDTTLVRFEQVDEGSQP